MPFSLFPLGPSGRAQIQNARPQLMPGFLVFMLMHGSWWPSHRGTGLRVKSLLQSSLLTIGSMTVSLSGSLLGVNGGSTCSAGPFVCGRDGGCLDGLGDRVFEGEARDVSLGCAAAAPEGFGETVKSRRLRCPLA